MKKLLLGIIISVLLLIEGTVVAEARCYQAVEKLSDYAQHCLRPRGASQGMGQHYRQMFSAMESGSVVPPQTYPIVPVTTFVSSMAFASLLVYGYPRYLAYPYWYYYYP